MSVLRKIQQLIVAALEGDNADSGVRYWKPDYKVWPLDLNCCVTQFRAHHSVRFEGCDLRVGLGEDFEMTSDELGIYYMTPSTKSEYIFPEAVFSERILWQRENRDDPSSEQTIRVMDKNVDVSQSVAGYVTTIIPCGVALHEGGFWTIKNWKIISKPPFMLLPLRFDYKGPEYYRLEKELEDNLGNPLWGR